MERVIPDNLLWPRSNIFILRKHKNKKKSQFKKEVLPLEL
jgi:hypothetical protein